MYYIVRFCGKLTFFLNCLYFNFFWRPNFLNLFKLFQTNFSLLVLLFRNSKKKCFEKSIFTVQFTRDHREIVRAEQRFSSQNVKNMIKNAKMSIRFFPEIFENDRFSQREPAKCKIIFAYPVSSI